MSEVLDRLTHLIGTWEGRETGAGGEGVTHRTYRLMFDRFLEARHRSIFEPQQGKPDGETHEELLIFSADGGDIVGREFHSDGMVISYVLHASGDGTLVFRMTGVENGPPGVVGLLTLTMDGEDRFTEVLELGPGFEALKEFIRIDWERADGSPDV